MAVVEEISGDSTPLTLESVLEMETEHFRVLEDVLIAELLGDLSVSHVLREVERTADGRRSGLAERKRGSEDPVRELAPDIETGAGLEELGEGVEGRVEGLEAQHPTKLLPIDLSDVAIAQVREQARGVESLDLVRRGVSEQLDQLPCLLSGEGRHDESSWRHP